MQNRRAVKARQVSVTPMQSTTPPSPSLSPAATHSQIMLLQNLKKANYQLPLLITDSGMPPLSNNTEVKVQVCICKKNKKICSSAHSHFSSLLVMLATLLLVLLCKYPHTEPPQGALTFSVCPPPSSSFKDLKINKILQTFNQQN